MRVDLAEKTPDIKVGVRWRLTQDQALKAEESNASIVQCLKEGVS